MCCLLERFLEDERNRIDSEIPANVLEALSVFPGLGSNPGPNPGVD